jgi:hypothetical protein
MKAQGVFCGWVLALLLITFPISSNLPASQVPPQKGTDIIQLTQFDAWRPYRNPNQLVRVGMNKGELLAIAGQPDHEESYYQSGQGRLTRVSDWYYTKGGENAETTLLKFVDDSLVIITSTPIR